MHSLDLILVFSTVLMFGQVNSEHFDLQNSPDDLTESLTLFNLTIDPGVEIYLDSDVALEVTGHLMAIGEIDKPITFILDYSAQLVLNLSAQYESEMSYIQMNVTFYSYHYMVISNWAPKISYISTSCMDRIVVKFEIQDIKNQIVMSNIQYSGDCFID